MSGRRSSPSPMTSFSFSRRNTRLGSITGLKIQMTNSPGPRRAAVLGHPIAHSLSPALHNSAYAQLGLDNWTYDAHDVTPEALPEFLAQMDSSWAGLSLTMPLKTSIQAHLDVIDPLAEVVGAVNTVFCQYYGGTREMISTKSIVFWIVAVNMTAGGRTQLGWL